jgi:hypothetical protein
MASEAEVDDPPPLASIEFGEADERRIARMAWAMGVVGLLQCVFGGLGMLFALWFAVQAMAQFERAPGAALLLGGMVLLFTALPLYQGILLREAGERVGRAVSSDDEDQEHIASAFRRLRLVFIIETVLTLPLVYGLVT